MTSEAMPPKPFSPQELADFWGVSRRTILRAIRRGDLPAVRIGPQSIRITRVDAAAYYARKSSGLSPVVPGCDIAPGGVLP